MREKANGTFLWVAFVAKELDKANEWEMLEVVKEMPPTLGELYERMMHQIERLDRGNPEFCRLVLSAATLAYRPLHLLELATVSGLPTDILAKMKSLRKIVALCGSFLTVQDDGFVYLVHQSAKDYLSDNSTTMVFSTGGTEVHRRTMQRSLQAMQGTLKRDIYSLRHPGFSISELKIPDPDPLAHVRYSCVHWVDHFYDIYSGSRPEDQNESDGKLVSQFLWQFCLYWLEALGLMQHVGDGILSMTRLENLLKVSLYLEL